MIEDGKPMGCSDSGPPEQYSDYALSRAVDVIHSIRAFVRHSFSEEYVHCGHRTTCNCVEEAVGDSERRMIEACVPKNMRFEITWTKWQYRRRR